MNDALIIRRQMEKGEQDQLIMLERLSCKHQRKISCANQIRGRKEAKKNVHQIFLSRIIPVDSRLLCFSVPF